MVIYSYPSLDNEMMLKKWYFNHPYSKSVAFHLIEKFDLSGLYRLYRHNGDRWLE